MPLIFIIGMPGSGKSYWMQQLSSFYNCTGLDLDFEIEKHSGKMISQLFEHGEAHFRATERNTLNSIIDDNSLTNAIIATGGGTPCFYNNIDMMNKDGTTVYLRAPINVLTGNIMRSQGERPLLKGLETSNAVSKISALLHEREIFYNRATITVDTEQISLATFAGILQPYISS